MFFVICCSDDIASAIKMMCITNLPLFMHTKIARQLTLARALRLELANLLLLERQKKKCNPLAGHKWRSYVAY